MKWVLLLLLCCSSRLLAQPPNVVLLLSDDQSWNGLSVAMDPKIPSSKSRYVDTPSIAQLARQGMRFSQAYSPSPVCSPTRASLQTGKSPARLHWTKAAPKIDPNAGFRLIPPQSERNLSQAETTLAELLKGAGYATAHYGKWHLGGGDPSAHGYDESDGDTSNRDAVPFLPPNPVDIVGMGRRAAAFMAKMTQAHKPFYIQLSYHALHYPQNALPETIASYREKMPGRRDKEILQAAMAENLDSGVGHLLKEIDRLGIADRTYVIYTSDNGGGGKDCPLRGGKGSLYEGGIRVPLVIRGPGVPADAVCRVPVAGFDLFPTICRLAQVQPPLPDGLEGGDITHLLKGDESPVQRAGPGIMFHFPHYQGATPQSALRQGEFKLIASYESDTQELYNVVADPWESVDLAHSLPGLAADMTRTLHAHLEAVGAALPTANPARAMEQPPMARKIAPSHPGGKKPRSRATGPQS